MLLHPLPCMLLKTHMYLHHHQTGVPTTFEMRTNLRSEYLSCPSCPLPMSFFHGNSAFCISFLRYYIYSICFCLFYIFVVCFDIWGGCLFVLEKKLHVSQTVFKTTIQPIMRLNILYLRVSVGPWVDGPTVPRGHSTPRFPSMLRIVGSLVSGTQHLFQHN